MSGKGLPATLRPSGMTAAWSLCSRELLTFFRQRSRVLSALMTPVLFWLFIGLGMGRSFNPGNGSRGGFETYFFPGVIILSVVFAGVFSTISTIQDRQQGFLQSVLVAPIPRWSIVFGKMLGGSIIAIFQGVVLLPLAYFAGIELSVSSLAASFGILSLVSLMMTGLGFYFAWKLDSVQGFHAVMNLLLMPMWILSGAFFPAAGAYKPIAWIMAVNPLTYGLAALRHVLLAGTEYPAKGLPSLWFCLILCTAVSIFLISAGARAVAKKLR